MRLIYLSPIPWSSFAQRPHFMVRYFLSCMCSEVVWIDPYPARLPKWTDLRRSFSLHRQGTQLEQGLKIIKPKFLPIDPLPGGYWVNNNIIDRKFSDKLLSLARDKDCILGIGKPCDLAVELLGCSCYKSSFYDAMDDFPQFHRGLSKKSMQKNENIIVDKVDNIFCSSDGLLEKFGNKKNLELIENAFDKLLLSTTRNHKRNDKPVIGYIGSLGDWFDWDLLAKLAQIGSYCEFRLIGPKLVPVPSDLPANINIYPPCRHDEIPRFLACFDVGLIPFINNSLTECVDPIKYYDYRSVGLPIMTTAFGQMKKRINESGVFEAVDGKLEASLRHALSFRFDSQDLEQWRANNNWTARFCKLKSVFADYITP